ncbi:hypothetical protein [Parasitella parasitica]|uniref:[histone H3]-trimethyl-L-lysine(9) demethylase n=1 Tax=Parasitella parasitica TaxID=35722 RepID=A0A0B7NJZ7_9FUNG|nr:hypothetical protein [Parasitella parasitica]
MTVAPTAYYDQENGGRIPIFTPSWDEFKDFKAFVENIEEYGKEAGIVKIIPPKEWRDQLPRIQQHQINNIKVAKPIVHIILTLNTSLEAEEYIRRQTSKTERNIHCNNGLISNKQHLQHVSFDSETSNLTVDEYKEIERNYWRNITFNQPMYGADMLGTLFNSNITSWNPNALDNTLNKLNQTLPGVNSPYLYFGMWKATFAWHVERCVQQAGEFIITYPFGYHSGYNLDFNCAESVNFAMDSWLEIGRKAKPCTCIDDSVVIDVKSLIDDVLNKQDGATKKRKFDEIVQKDSACILCANPPLPSEPLLATNENINCKHIHKVCAEAVDETYVVKNVVHGIGNIPASRWKLVCLFCKKKEGACMQCCYGKCWKAFHATCAIEHGATMDRVHADASNPHSLYDGYCPQHDPKRINEKKRLKEIQIKKMITKLQVGLEVHMKWRGGGQYTGTVSECLPDQKMCRVLLTDGTERKVPWRDIV